MKKLIILLTVLILMTGCSPKPQEPVKELEPEVNYSLSRVIVFHDGSLTEDDIKALLKKYHMTIIYDYSDMNGFAADLDHAYEVKDFENLLITIGKEPGIISADRDYFVEVPDCTKGPC